MLADMAVEVMAAKSTIYRVAWEIDSGVDRKVVHARASALKRSARFIVIDAFTPSPLLPR